jgi:hypothetical protein
MKFHIAPQTGICQLTCPGEQVLDGRRYSDKGKITYRFIASEDECLKCKYADKCFNKTKGKKKFSIEEAIFENFEALEQQKEKMETKEELDIYHKRLGIVEPVFGTITHHRNFKQFLVRGIDKVKLQWSMVCTAFNLKRIWMLGLKE